MNDRATRRRLPLALAAAAFAACSPVAVDAATRCAVKTADGTGPTEKVARFQVYEGLLRSVDTDLWSAWIVTGKTPGYRVSKPATICKAKMGLGVSCRGKASICRL